MMDENTEVSSIEGEGFAVGYLMQELDDLRDSGEMNMFGAPGWLQKAFGLSSEDATQVFWYWTDNGAHADQDQ